MSIPNRPSWRPRSRLATVFGVRRHRLRRFDTDRVYTWTWIGAGKKHRIGGVTPSYHQKIHHIPINISRMNHTRTRSILLGSGSTSIKGGFIKGLFLCMLIVIVGLLNYDRGVFLFWGCCLFLGVVMGYMNGGLGPNWGLLFPSAVPITLMALSSPTVRTRMVPHGAALRVYEISAAKALLWGALFAGIGLLIAPVGYALGWGLARLRDGLTTSS